MGCEETGHMLPQKVWILKESFLAKFEVVVAAGCPTCVCVMVKQSHRPQRGCADTERESRLEIKNPTPNFKTFPPMPTVGVQFSAWEVKFVEFSY